MLYGSTHTIVSLESKASSCAQGLISQSPGDVSQVFNAFTKFICVHDHIYADKKKGFSHTAYKYSRGQAIPVQDLDQFQEVHVSKLDNAISNPLSHVRLLTSL